MADRLLGVFGHELLQFGFGLLMIEVGCPRAGRRAVDLSWKRIDTEATLYYPHNRQGRPFRGSDGIRKRKTRKLKEALLSAVDASDVSDPAFRLRAYISGLARNKPGALVRMCCRFLDFEKAQLKKEQKAALRRRRGKGT
jgi:hypothetical protein